jgi:hypothetical protein
MTKPFPEPGGLGATAKIHRAVTGDYFGKQAEVSSNALRDHPIARGHQDDVPTSSRFLRKKLNHLIAIRKGRYVEGHALCNLPLHVSLASEKP